MEHLRKPTYLPPAVGVMVGALRPSYNREVNLQIEADHKGWRIILCKRKRNTIKCKPLC